MKFNHIQQLLEADMSPYMLAKGNTNVNAMVGVEIEGYFSLKNKTKNVEDIKNIDQFFSYFKWDNRDKDAVLDYIINYLQQGEYEDQPRKWYSDEIKEAAETELNTEQRHTEKQWWGFMMKDARTVKDFIRETSAECLGRYDSKTGIITFNGSIIDYDKFAKHQILHQELLVSEYAQYIQEVAEETSLTGPYAEHFGAEVITKPIPYKNVKKVLTGLFEWLDTNYKFITHDSTGFHINVSINGRHDIDFVKLLVFLGETHELMKYDRLYNKYCKPHSSRLTVDDTEDEIFASSEHIEWFLEKMRGQIKDFGKLSSFNTLYWEKMHYIEFRIAGGDYKDRMGDVFASMDRYVKVLDIATDKNKYREEYLKKVAKMFSSTNKLLVHEPSILNAHDSIELKINDTFSSENGRSICYAAKKLAGLVDDGKEIITSNERIYLRTIGRKANVHIDNRI